MTVIVFMTFYGLIEDIGDAARCLQTHGAIVHNISLLEHIHQNPEGWFLYCKSMLERIQPNIIVWWYLCPFKQCERLRQQFRDTLFVFFPWDDPYAWKDEYQSIFDIVLPLCAYTNEIRNEPSVNIHENVSPSLQWITHSEAHKIPYAKRKEELSGRAHLFIHPSCLYRDIVYSLLYGTQTKVIGIDLPKRPPTWVDWMSLFWNPTVVSPPPIPEWLVASVYDVHSRRKTYRSFVSEMEVEDLHSLGYNLEYKNLNIL